MAIAYAQSISGRSASGASSFQLSLPSNPSAGSLICVAASNEADAAFTFSDDQGNTYASPAPVAEWSGSRSLGMSYAPNITGGAITVTATASATGGRIYLSVHEATGDTTFLELDQANGAVGNDTNPQSGNVTTTVADEYAFAAVMAGAIGAAADAPWTARENVVTAFMSADQILSSTGTLQADFTCNSGSWACGILTFADDSQLGGGTTQQLTGDAAGASSDSVTASLDVGLAGDSAGASSDDVPGIVLNLAGTNDSPGTSSDSAVASLAVAVTGDAAGTSSDSGAVTTSGTVSLTGDSPGTSSDSATASLLHALIGDSAGGSSDAAAVSGVEPVVANYVQIGDPRIVQRVGIGTVSITRPVGVGTIRTVP